MTPEEALALNDSLKKEEEYEDTAEEAGNEQLEEASKLLKSSATLFDFISDPILMGRLSARERKIIQKHVVKLRELSEKIDSELNYDWE